MKPERAYLRHAWLQLALPLGLTGAVLPATAHAFSDPTRFAQPIATVMGEAGGGEGRYFTGSPSDGYTCGVCHQGAEGPPLHILGLPLDGYQPGASYEVTVDWPDGLDHVSLALEITDETGNAAGAIKMPPSSELPISEQCLPAIAAHPIGAGMVTPVTTPATMTSPMTMRSVVQMADCGARQLRFLWTAPMLDAGPVWLAGGVVATDGMANNTGDGVTAIARAISSPSSRSLVASSETTSCAVTHVRTHPLHGSGLALASLLGIAIAVGAVGGARVRARRRAARKPAR